MALLQSFKNNSLRAEISEHCRSDESAVLDALLPLAQLPADALARVNSRALDLAARVRQAARNGSQIKQLLNQYSLSTNEGIVLMCLAEALLRVPDKTTADRLIRDKLISGDWSASVGGADSLFVNSAAWGLVLAGRVVAFNEDEKRRHTSIVKHTIGHVGEPLVRQAMRLAMGIMGSQFVLGRNIDEALKISARQEARGYCYSYDMLGEAARTMQDADAYFEAYQHAIARIGTNPRHRDIHNGAGISVKLSALHPRYELLKRKRMIAELAPRLLALALLAKQYNMGLTVDAEEADRLDISLDIIEAVYCDPQLDGWDGFGIVVQAYQKRALYVLNWIIDLSRRVGRKMMLRLVKGAYWDAEIKNAQVEGLEGYPVFTRKASTDVSYQACAGLLLDNRDAVYPQFATHNAYSVAYIMERAHGDFGGFEFQLLHGMGEGLYDDLIASKSVPVRIYAPVGEHKSLLAYLVRRLLENGANSSFVNNVVDDHIPLAQLVADPVENVMAHAQKVNPHIPLPKDIYGRERVNSLGVDLADIPTLETLSSAIADWSSAHVQFAVEPGPNAQASVNPANTSEILGFVPVTTRQHLSEKLALSSAAFVTWSKLPVNDRAACLERLADNLEQHMQELVALCTKEAGKTIQDGVAEVREAVDFCRYYALQSRKVCAPHISWGDKGHLTARGVVVCISPWNFPLAIFLGQVTAALSVGNTVLAKPSDATALIAARAIELMVHSGIPADVVQLIVCDGAMVGAHLLPDTRVAAVMFTGSTAVGQGIARTLAQRPGQRIPLIAETGGQNCMVVDSTALPEQVVDDVIASGFQSAGQRCSALRVLYLQEEIADEVIAMIVGAMQELEVGNPADLATDIGPVIDEKALSMLNTHVEFMRDNGKLIYACRLGGACSAGTFFAPRLYEISNIGVLPHEIFGPIVHVVRYRAKALDQVLAAINSTGYGLTGGVHSRVQATATRVVNTVNAGNIYINRNTIGAVVGVQPFGGHGLSGTGPKAGGPSYLYRVVRQPQEIESPDLDEGMAIARTLQPTPPAVPLRTLQGDSLASWRAVSVARRAEQVAQLLTLLGDISPAVIPDTLLPQVSVMIDEALAGQSQPTILAGPTGETNQLILEPRGLLLCLQHSEEDRQNSLRQLMAALLCGNQVLHVTSDPFRLEALMEQVGLDHVYQRSDSLDAARLEALLLDDALQGVAVSGPQALIRSVDVILAAREGALRPLITETVGPAMMRRFVLEKTVSNNTTASGGNASLLAMADG